MNKAVKIAIVVAIASYFSYSPAPEDAPKSWIAHTVMTTLVRFIFQLSEIASVRYDNSFGVKILRGLSQPSPVSDEIEHSVVELENFSLEIFKPKTYSGGHGAIINIHGGGFTVGNVPTIRQFCSNMALDSQTIVIAPEYRLAPEHPYPAAVDDCLETVKYVFDNAEELGIDRTKIVLTGDSAGGQLTLVTALGLVGTDYQLKGIFPVYPATQSLHFGLKSMLDNDRYLLSKYDMAWFYSQYMTGSTENVEDFLSGKVLNEATRQSPAVRQGFELYDQSVPDLEDIVVSSEFADMVEKLIDYRMSPLFAPLDMLMDLPPSKIYVCTRDVLADDGRLMVKMLEDAGNIDTELIEWEGAVHAEVLLSRQAIGSMLVPKATLWVKNYINDMKVMTD